MWCTNKWAQTSPNKAKYFGPIYITGPLTVGLAWALWLPLMRRAVRCSQIPSHGQTERWYSAPELLRPPPRASGEMWWYAGKTFSISSSSKSQRGFSYNATRRVYSTPSKHPRELRAHPPLQTRKQGFATPIWALRSTEGNCSLTTWRCSSGFGESLCWEPDVRLCALWVCSSAACQTLKGVFKCAPAAMHSLNDLFIC